MLLNYYFKIVFVNKKNRSQISDKFNENILSNRFLKLQNFPWLWFARKPTIVSRPADHWGDFRLWILSSILRNLFEMLNRFVSFTHLDKSISWKVLYAWINNSLSYRTSKAVKSTNDYCTISRKMPQKNINILCDIIILSVNS